MEENKADGDLMSQIPEAMRGMFQKMMEEQI
jgi:hypothetical protein